MAKEEVADAAVHETQLAIDHTRVEAAFAQPLRKLSLRQVANCVGQFGEEFRLGEPVILADAHESFALEVQDLSLRFRTLLLHRHAKRGLSFQEISSVGLLRCFAERP